MRSTISHIKLFGTKVLLNLLSRRKDLDPNQVILIVSDPRSGSTWLSEVLSTINQSYIIDEPLHINNVHELKALKFEWRQHIPVNRNWPAAKQFFKNLFSGKINNPSISKLGSAKNGQQLIVKTIRAKLLLPWLCQQFNFTYKPIVLVRHPLAMIASLKKHNAFDYPFNKIKSIDHVFEKHLSFLSKLETNTEQQLALWCLANKYLSEIKDVKWMVIKYESLIRNFDHTINYIFKTWGLKLPLNIKESKLRASSSTTKKTFDLDTQLHGWKDVLSPEEVDRYNMILKYFSIDYDNLYQS